MTPDQRQPNFQRVAVTLQQRLAEKVAQYEGEIALQKDTYETQIEELQEQLQELTDQLAALNDAVSPEKK